MRLAFISLALMLLTTLLVLPHAAADEVIPPEKPIKPKGLLLRPFEKPVGDDGFVVKNENYMVNVGDKQTSSVITPPDLPPVKSRLISVDSINGVITPTIKPLTVRPTVIERITPALDFEEDVIVRYANDDDNRMAGGNRSRQSARGLPEQPRVQMKETNAQSPFETASLPRAEMGSRQQDPVIIFFRERASELEVGQISVIDNDIVAALKNSPSKMVSIYGYAGGRSSDTYNPNDLSLSRAMLISNYLIEQGIDVARIEARSMGADTPISPKNRVDVFISD